MSEHGLERKGTMESWELDEASRNYYKSVFAKRGLDDCDELSLDEVAECLSEFGVELERKELREIVKYFDRNGDGKFMVKELLDNLMSIIYHLNQGKEVMRAFRIIDKKNTGFIRLPVLKQILTAGDGGFTAAEAEKILGRLLREFDENGDGKFDYSEFLRMYDSGQNPFV